LFYVSTIDYKDKSINGYDDAAYYKQYKDRYIHTCYRTWLLLVAVGLLYRRRDEDDEEDGAFIKRWAHDLR
jgi:hypothetical protein